MSLQACSHRSSAHTWVIVEVHGTEFAIAANCVREILGMPDITAVPLCRPQTRGVINLRGRVIPLIDMRKRFTADQHTFAVAIDRAIAVEAIPPELIKEAQTEVRSPKGEPVRRVVERTAAKSLAIVLEPEMFGVWPTV